ncbi:MAG: dihydroorotase [Clostridia bacterium]
MKLLLKHADVLQNGAFRTMDVAVAHGLIQAIAPHISPAGFDFVFPLYGFCIVPGFVDVHVHLREPGFSFKETMATGTYAAARGGYTTVCAMPNVTPAPDCMENLRVQQAAIAASACVKVLPYGTLTRGRRGCGEASDYEALFPHVVAFSDDGNGVQDVDAMRESMRRVHALDGLIAAHCEEEALVAGGYIHAGAYARAHGHAGISARSEWAMIARDLALVRETGCRYHVCHVSTRRSVELIRAAKAEGLPVTCETAPHYLMLCDADLQEDGRFKMNPPLRGAEDREALREGLLDDTIDLIATDHAPHTVEEKARGLRGSAMGVVGLECAFPVLYTGLVRTGILSLARLVDKLSLAPRRIFRLGGALSKGQPADLAVLDLDRSYRIDPGTFASMGRSTPFAGMQVTGENIMTFVEGKIVWQK